MNASRFRVFVSQPIPTTAAERLRAIADLDMGQDSARIMPRAELIEHLRAADAFVHLMHDVVDAEAIAAAPRLKVIASMSIGPATLDVKAATARKIPVTTIPPMVGEATADLHWALLMAVARRVVESDVAVRRGIFPGSQSMHFIGAGVHGKTLGIVGMGRIGTAVARRARGFEMKILYTKRSRLPEAEERQLGATFTSLEDLLREADYVSLHPALTPQTRHLIGARELSLMKPAAILVNTSRGPVVDEAALVAALTSRQIAGAGLDVFAVEPLPADSVLRTLDRVILTPHLAASTAEAQERVAVEICSAVRDALIAGDLSCAINVPGMGGDLLRRLAPLLDLARRLGRLALALADGPVKAVEIAYGGKEEAAQRSVLVAALEGLLAAMNVSRVSLVNAQVLAEERGIRLGMRTGAPDAGFETSIGVKVDTARGRVRVAGALIGGSHGRVIRIDDYHVDVAPDGWMLVIRNRDVPGVIGRVGSALGSAGINIASYHQARRAAQSAGVPGDALAAINVDQALTNGVLEKLQTLADVLDVRLANFGD
jgi:D-3-phosphoglycerate dehydrogenase